MNGVCVCVCRSREEAFKIGAEIAREVTASNPSPVTLKFEKVYHPCVLLTKKRYVGYMYETPTQVTSSPPPPPLLLTASLPMLVRLAVSSIPNNNLVCHL